LGYHLSKHKMTGYAKNLGGSTFPWGPPGFPYASDRAITDITVH